MFVIPFLSAGKKFDQQVDQQVGGACWIDSKFSKICNVFSLYLILVVCKKSPKLCDSFSPFSPLVFGLFPIQQLHLKSIANNTFW